MCRINSVCFVCVLTEGVSKDGQTVSEAELGIQFTEIFIKKADNVSLLLGLLEVQYSGTA